MAARVRRRPPALDPLSPQKKWRAITLATLLLVPAYWAILAGAVTLADEGDGGAAAPGALLAFGLALIPFVFVVLAFLSEQPNPAGAAAKAMGLAVLVGIPASVIALDGVTGIVAGVGAGGIVALRADEGHTWKARALAVLVASVYTMVLVRVAGAAALLPAPIFPFTGIGVADHLSERKYERASAGS